MYMAQERTVYYTTVDADGALQELVESETSNTEVCQYVNMRICKYVGDT